MIPELAWAAVALALGLPAARLLDRQTRGTEWIGEGLLAGAGLIAAILLVPGLMQIPWSRTMFLATAMTLAIAGWVVERRQSRPVADIAIPARSTAWLLYAIILITLAGYASYATVAPPPEFDYLADWGAKGRVFFESRTIDWSFLERASYRATHPDYPPLLPLSFDAIALIRGGWDDRAAGVVNVLFAVALVLVVHGAALDELRDRTRAALVALAALPFAAVPWIGIGEGPFIAFATSALLLLRRGRWTAGACLLGLAAATKNEGLALIAAVAIATVATRNDSRTRTGGLFALWPAVAIPLPWLIARAVHRLPTDVIAGNIAMRIAAHLRDPQALAAAFSITSLGKPLLWIALIIGVVMGARRLVERERFVLLAIAIQCALYVGAYLASPHDLAWHVRWSWERLVAHLTPALTTVVMLALLREDDCGMSAPRREPEKPCSPG